MGCDNLCNEQVVVLCTYKMHSSYLLFAVEEIKEMAPLAAPRIHCQIQPRIQLQQECKTPDEIPGGCAGLVQKQCEPRLLELLAV